MVISILSDTHNELPPVLLREITGSDLIIHAGDFQDPATLAKLEQFAPVAAVRGNCDRGPLSSLPEILSITREDTRILIIHNLNRLYPENIPPDTDIIICGHTHVPSQTEHRGITWLNPGSPTLPRGGSNPGFIRLHLKDGSRTIEQIQL